MFLENSLLDGRPLDQSPVVLANTALDWAALPSGESVTTKQCDHCCTAHTLHVGVGTGSTTAWGGEEIPMEIRATRGPLRDIKGG